MSTVTDLTPGRTAELESAREAALDRARALTPALRARAPAADTDRRLPDATIAELHDAGLFNVIRPRLLGGEELGIASLLEITAELASACGSTGWVYGVLAGHGWLLNLFPIEAQREILAERNALTATVFRLGGLAERVAGGYRISDATGKFCSGIDFASWVIVGNAVRNPSGPPEPRFFVVGRKDIEVVDDWFTIGMRGTGSRSIRIRDAFVPEHFSVTIESLARGRSPGAEAHTAPLYRMPFQLVAPFSIIGAPVGIARGAAELYKDGLSAFLADESDIEIAGKAATLSRIGQTSAEADAAFALVHAAATRIDRTADPAALSPRDRARFPRDWAWAAQTSRDAVSRLFTAAGGAATFEGSDIQRLWRDVNAASQHFAFVWDNAMSDFGRVALGLEPLNTIPGKRR